MLKVDHEKYKNMYPFGTDAVFSVPVEKIEEAPLIFVYRSVNKKYVMDTFKRMIENSSFIPLLPFSLSKRDSVKLETYASTHQLRMSKPDQLVEALIKDKDIVLLAISGQHSNRAQQLIMNSARVPEKIKNHNRYKKSRILDGQHESWKYHDISYQDNKNNEQAYFVPSFVECLRQARSQWIELGRPQDTQGSNKKNHVFEQFKSTVSQTMRRKSYKDVISLVCCSDVTFEEFENFVVAWEKGDIPDVYGALGKPKGERDGPEDIVALKEYCKVLKGKRTLGKTIVRYWLTRYQEDFNTWGQLAESYTMPEKWLGEMLKYLQEKPENEVVTEDVSSSDGDDEDSSKKKKKPKKKSASVDVLPSQIKMQLHKFHCAKHGMDVPQRLEPLEVLHIKDITQYQLTLDEKHDCKLVFLDLTHPDLVNWEKQELSCFLGIVKELTSLEGFVIVAFMDFGKPLTALHPTCNEYATKKGLEDLEPEKGEGAEQLNVKNKIPRWEFVNMSLPDGEPLTHHICKRRRFCYRIVVNYSEVESTVLDLFSGGIFAREALLSGRDVIYFANSEPEAIFLKEYGKARVRYSERVRLRFQRYKSVKVPTSSSPQPALASSSQQPGLASTRLRASSPLASLPMRTK
ncbi:hypothetical protein R1sor_008629 [Riccia sorocarpa]|uniref:Uncharacterized protein n=1 Tax=Riccia sorocarpa TaxID=122646 RepID=A0ABD3HU61_9MARC